MQQDPNNPIENQNDSVIKVVFSYIATFFSGVCCGIYTSYDVKISAIPNAVFIFSNRDYHILPWIAGVSIGSYLSLKSSEQTSNLTSSILCDPQGTCVQNNCLAEDFLDHTVCKM